MKGKRYSIVNGSMFLISFFMILFIAAGASHAAGNWWDKFGKPQYGGTFAVRMHALADSFDPAQPMGAGLVHYYWYEHMLTVP